MEKDINTVETAYSDHISPGQISLDATGWLY